MLHKAGLLFNRRAFWIGLHYSTYNKRLCINFLPCFTVYLVFTGGIVPRADHL